MGLLQGYSLYTGIFRGKGRYLISRNVHKSVFHGLDLAKAQAQATFTAMHQSNLTCQYVEPILEDD